MNSLKKMFYGGVSVVPMRLLRGATEVLLPYHHLVSDEPAPHIAQLFPYKNKRQFVRDLDYLLTHFHALDPGELIEAVRQDRSISPGGFLLSFDDGLREVYDVVAPLLLQKGVPALFFLNSAFIDNRELFYRSKASLIVERLRIDRAQAKSIPRGILSRVCEILGLAEGSDVDAVKRMVLGIRYPERAMTDDVGECLGLSFADYLAERRPYLSGDQIGELAGKGFYFGGHSVDHPNYKILSLKEQLEQTRRSCEEVRQRFGLGYTVFSFPHEDAPVQQEFFDALAAPGEPVVEVLFGTQNQKTERNNRIFHRFNAERPEYGIEGLVKGVLAYNRICTSLRTGSVRRGYR